MTEGSGRPERREIEVKLPCPDLPALRKKLAELSAICTAPLHFETNDLYDDSEGRLSKSGCALRLRRAGGATILTFKGPARFSDAVKIREERETAVADDEETRAILAGLGLNRRFRYEKRREEWRLESVSVCLDETPIGNFVEVEGDPAAIRRALSSLQLDFAAALPYSYARLYAERRKHDPSLPEDMVFGDREAGGGRRDWIWLLSIRLPPFAYRLPARMRAFLLAAGHGVRFRPVTASIPKPLFPFLNVPLIRAHLARLRRQGVSEAGVNLHHLGEQIEGELGDRPPDLPKLHFFREPTILGTAGGLRNASDWLAGGDFLVLNTDAAIAPDVAGLFARHRASGRAATLLVVENRDPDRYTPLEAEGDRIVGFGGRPARPLLYTGVCVLSPRVLPLILPGERSLVADLWRPLLETEPDPIGWVLHEGPFSDLGVPRDFLRASLEALERSGPFPVGAGTFDPETRVLSQLRPDRLDIRSSVIGDARIDPTARIHRSVIWSGVSIGSGARVIDCLVAGGRVPDGAISSDSLLWPGMDGIAAEHPLPVS